MNESRSHLDDPAYDLKLERYESAMGRVKLNEDSGKITRVVGQVMTGYLPAATLGSVCGILSWQWFS